MKLVFTRAEVAEALGKTIGEFNDLLPGLEELGFPKPVRGLGDSWAIMEVLRWVNGEGSSMRAAHLLADEADDVEPSFEFREDRQAGSH